MSHLHIDQCNIPCAAQINVVANKQSRCSSCAGDLFMTQPQYSLKHAFWGALNNGANTSNLTSTNVSKSH